MNAQDRVATANAEISRLQELGLTLEGELISPSQIVDQLVSGAQQGDFGDLVERVARALAIRAILPAIPQAIGLIADERNGILRSRSEEAARGARKAAKAEYAASLKQFDERYVELARSKDHDALPRAAKSLFQLAVEAGKAQDLRKYFRSLKSRHRANELTKF